MRQVKYHKSKFWIWKTKKFVWRTARCLGLEYEVLGFPGGTVVKNPPANAGDMGSSPATGRSHMPRNNWAHEPQLLSLCSRAREPQLLSLRAITTEAHVPRAHALQQEKPLQ